MDIPELVYWQNYTTQELKEKTIKEICEETGLKDHVVRYQYKKLGLKFKSNIPKLDFEQLKDFNNYEGLYLVGFLAADGYINGNSITLWIHEKDCEILKRIMIFFNKPDLLTMIRKSETGSQLLGINLCSKDLVEFLRKEYGFENRKGETLPFPSHLKDPLPFLRGYMDGNGHIGHGCVFSTASEKFKEGLIGWVKAMYGFEPNIQLVGTNKKCFNLTYRKKHSRFIKDLFEFDGLSRKNKAFLEYLPKEEGIEAQDKKPVR